MLEKVTSSNKDRFQYLEKANAGEGVFHQTTAAFHSVHKRHLTNGANYEQFAFAFGPYGFAFRGKG